MPENKPLYARRDFAEERARLDREWAKHRVLERFVWRAYAVYCVVMVAGFFLAILWIAR